MLRGFAQLVLAVSWAGSLLAFAAACEAGGRVVTVEVLTDYRPGQELTAVELLATPAEGARRVVGRGSCVAR